MHHLLARGAEMHSLWTSITHANRPAMARMMASKANGSQRPVLGCGLGRLETNLARRKRGKATWASHLISCMLCPTPSPWSQPTFQPSDNQTCVQGPWMPSVVQSLRDSLDQRYNLVSSALPCSHQVYASQKQAQEVQGRAHEILFTHVRGHHMSRLCLRGLVGNEMAPARVRDWRSISSKQSDKTPSATALVIGIPILRVSHRAHASGSCVAASRIQAQAKSAPFRGETRCQAA
ncbi:hypothetical protein HDV57DRAFT_395764 [Trichoderma longibrachiatum]